VKPSPITCQLTAGWKKASSPVSERPFTNCTTPACMPWPWRASTPKAALDLPLPLPVFTSSTPRVSVAAAMAASTTLLTFHAGLVAGVAGEGVGHGVLSMGFCGFL
jgi:hypothetical protein